MSQLHQVGERAAWRRSAGRPRFTLATSVACIASVLPLLAAPAHAQNEWTGGAAPDLNFLTADNWSEGVGPEGYTGDLIVNMTAPSSPTLLFSAAGTNYVDAGQARLLVGSGAGGNGAMDIATLALTPGSGPIGYTLFLDASLPDGTAGLVVGEGGGTGVLNVRFGSPVSSDEWEYLSLSGGLDVGIDGGSGEVNVLGQGKPSFINSVSTHLLVNGHGLRVGVDGGTGTLTLRSAGLGTREIASNELPLVIGQGLGSTGTVNVLAGSKIAVAIQGSSSTPIPSTIGQAGGSGVLNLGGLDDEGRFSRGTLGSGLLAGSGAGSQGSMNVLADGKMLVAQNVNTPMGGPDDPPGLSLIAGTEGGIGHISAAGANANLYISGGMEFGNGSDPLPTPQLKNIGTAYLGVDGGIGTMAIADGGRVVIGRAFIDTSTYSLVASQGVGTLYLTRDAGSSATLRIGAAPGEAAVAPGTLEAGLVSFGPGTGRVEFNHTGGDYSFSTPLVGTGTLATHAGTTWLRLPTVPSIDVVDPNTGEPVPLDLPTDNSAFAGLAELHGGTLGLGYSSALGAASVDALGNSALAYADAVSIANPITIGSGVTLDLRADGSAQATQTGAIGGAGHLAKQGSGSVTLTSVESYTGDTSVAQGTLALAGSGAIAASHGVDVAAGATFDIAATAAGATIQSLSGAGGVNLGGQTLTLSDARDTFAGAFSGSGDLRLASGTETLTGASPAFTGATRVDAGRLIVNGSIANSPTTVASGATLAGVGTVGHLVTQGGGIVAPGNSIGTLHVNGSYEAQAGSVYQAEYGDTVSDLLEVSGSATLAPGAQIQAIHVPGTLVPMNHRYTVVSAAGGVSGTYSLTGETRPTPFITLFDTYDADHVYLEARQTAPLVPTFPTGYTPNQIAAAYGAQSLPENAPVKLALLWSPTLAAARHNLDQVSGELHASIQSAMVQDSRYVREAALDRLRESFCAPGAQGTINDGQRRDGEGGTGCAPDRERVAWARVMGSWGHIDGDGNAARLEHSIGGVFAGVDTSVDAGWRIGALAGYTHGNEDVDERNSSASTDTYHLGLYAGTQWDATGLRLGASYSTGRVDARRGIVMTDFADSLRAKYDADTTQVFAELGQRLDFGATRIEPFANLAWLNARRDAFLEQGGPAALHGDDQNLQATVTTLGARLATQLSDSTRLTAMLGWRHMFGRQTPMSTHAFWDGAPFTVYGVPIAQDVAVVEAGVETRLRKDLTLSASYSGQFGSNQRDQGFKVNLAWHF